MKFPSPQGTTIVKTPVIARPPPPLSGLTLVVALWTHHNMTPYGNQGKSH